MGDTETTTASKTPRTTMRKRADLKVSPGVMDKVLRTAAPGKFVSKYTRVALAAAVEYLMAEVIEGSKQYAERFKHKRIKSRDIRLAVCGDADLSKLLKHVIIVDGGVIPATVPSKKKK